MRRLPRHVILVLARIIGTLAWLADVRGRTTATENIRVAFGELFTWPARHTGGHFPANAADPLGGTHAVPTRRGW